MQKIRSSRFKAFSLIEMSIVILIIGVLTSGVIAGSRMYNSARLATAKSLTSNSPVAGMKDLYLWLDATAEKSFLKNEANDGKTISVWYDTNPQNMQSLSFKEVTNFQKPIYQTSSYKGLPSVNFKLTGNKGSLLRTDSLFDLPQQFTIFAVSQVDGAFTTSEIQILNTGPILLRYGPLPSAFVYNGTTPEPRAQLTQSTFGIPNLLVASFDGARLTLTRNQATSVSVARATTPAQRGNVPQIYSGASSNSRIFEVILFYKKLTDEETAAVAKYLNQKWQIY